MGWLGETMAQRRRRKELLRSHQLLGARTPEQIAENLRNSDLAERIPTSDLTQLARDIAGLSERERYILARTVEGTSQEDLTRELFLAQNTVKLHLDRIVEHLGDEGGEK